MRRICEGVKDADQRVQGFLTCHAQARNLVLICEVRTRLMVLPLEVDLTDLSVIQRHFNLGMAEEFFHGRQACTTAKDLCGIRMPAMSFET